MSQQEAELLAHTNLRLRTDTKADQAAGCLQVAEMSDRSSETTVDTSAAEILLREAEEDLTQTQIRGLHRELLLVAEIPEFWDVRPADPHLALVLRQIGTEVGRETRLRCRSDRRS